MSREARLRDGPGAAPRRARPYARETTVCDELEPRRDGPLQVEKKITVCDELEPRRDEPGPT